MNWTIEYNGLHGYKTVTFRVPEDTKEGDIVCVSQRVAKRLNDAVCGISDCTCFEVVADRRPFGPDAAWTVGPLPENGGMMYGAYSQS